MPIRLLPQYVVDQIAAGEVVERPASVVKELIENSIDAGARRVAVQIEEGGCALIRVSDDGSGIPADELPLAVAAHATSKIQDAADLEGVRSLGFRGEALAAMGSVSRLRLVSGTGGTTASSIEVDHGRVSAVSPAARSRGTDIEVRTLFGQVPARRKFMKSPPAEAARITEAVEAVALANPEVAFTLRSGERQVLDLPSRSDWRDRVTDVLGPELRGHLIPLETAAEAEPGRGVRVRGLAGRPDTARATSRALRIHVNGRAIVDRSLIHAVREAYRGLLEPSRFPTAILFLDCDPGLVDVNVHPAKSEVRFRQAAFVHRVVHRVLREALAAADLVGNLSIAAPAPVNEVRRDWPRVGAPTAAAPTTFAPRSISPRTQVDEVLVAEPRRQPPVMQVAGNWIVYGEGEAIVVIDQHALHERLMFEELMARVERAPLESQPLLAPLGIDADAGMIERLESLSAPLERAGFDIRLGGQHTLAVHAVPTLLHSRGVEAGPFIRQLLERDGAAGAVGRSTEAILADILDTMACKAAVKAGDHLSAEELQTLVTRAGETERSTRCPHGRPTMLRIPIIELERRFGRR